MYKTGTVLLGILMGWIMHAAAGHISIPASEFNEFGAASRVDDHLVFSGPAEVKVAVRVPFQGDYNLVVISRGGQVGGTPVRARVLLDGITVGELDAVPGNQWRTHTLPVNLDEGERLISIRSMHDDGTAESGEVRNFHLYGITLVQQEEVPGVEAISRAGFEEFQEKRRIRILEEAAVGARLIRQGPVVVQVLDEAGAPVDRASVTLQTVNPAFKLGTALPSKVFDPEWPISGHVAYKSLVEKNFNEVVPEDAMEWSVMEPLEGQVHSKTLDGMVQWAAEKGLSIRGRGMFRSHAKHVPEWVDGLGNDALALRIEQRIQKLAEGYPQITEYEVSSGMLHGSYYRDRLGPEICGRMFRLSSQAAPKSALYITDFNILNGLQTDEYIKLIESLLADGVPVSGIGVQAGFQDKVDVAVLRQVLDQLAVFELPIKLTELAVQADHEDLQAKSLEDIMRVAYGHPSVTGVCLWGLWENTHSRPQAALYGKDFSPRAAGVVLEKLVQEWRPAYVKDTGPEGLVDDTLAYGTCQLTVESRAFGRQSLTFEHRPHPQGDPTRMTVVLETR